MNYLHTTRGFATLRRATAIVAALAAATSCENDQRSVTGVPRGLRPAATVVSSDLSADTYLGIDAVNYSTGTRLNLYTWPDNKIANAIVMKFDLSSIPPGSTITSATLNLVLVESDAFPDPTYTVTVHKIVNKNPVVSSATGYTYDGVNGWTPNTCCNNNIPLAQADIGAAVDTKAIDKTPGLKQWNVTSIVQGWFSNPATNYGLLVNSDPSKLHDRFRYFGSSESADQSQRPSLTVVYTASAPQWSHQPPGFTVLTDWAMDQTPPASSADQFIPGSPACFPGGPVWKINYNNSQTGSNGELASITLESDAGAPFSPPNTWRWKYPVGFAAGSSPGKVYCSLGNGRELYFGYVWKASNPWHGHWSGVNKISFVFGPNNMIVDMNGAAPPYHLQVNAVFPHIDNTHLPNSWGPPDTTARHLSGNVNPDYVVTPGQWYRIEVYFKMSTTNTSRDGIIRWWANDTLVGDYTNVNFDITKPFEEFQFAPTWGGMDSTKAETDYYWYDHVRLSAP